MDNEKEELKQKIIKQLVPGENRYDSLLATASFTLLAGSLAVVTFSGEFSLIVTVFQIISVISLGLALLLLLWYNPRLSVRAEKMSGFLNDRLDKLWEETKEFTRLYESPVYRAKLVAKLKKYSLKSGEEQKDYEQIFDKASAEVYKEMDQDGDRRNLFTKLVYKSFLIDVYFSSEEVFEKPLSEKFRKMKFAIDMISWKARYQFFVIGIVSLVLSVIAHLLS